jgi:polyisoprenoid-binding protein YceI
MVTASIETGDDRRDHDLRSPQFLDAASFPLIRYGTTELAPDNGHWRMTGELDLHGQVCPLVLDVDFLGAFDDPWGGHRIGFLATGPLSRERWGLTYNERLETGGVLVSRTVGLDLAVTAVYEA